MSGGKHKKPANLDGKRVFTMVEARGVESLAKSFFEKTQILKPPISLAFRACKKFEITQEQNKSVY